MSKKRIQKNLAQIDAGLRNLAGLDAELLGDGALRVHPAGGDWPGYAPGASFATTPLIDAERRLGWKLGGVIDGLAQSPMDIEPDKPETWDSMLDILALWAASSWDWAERQGK